MDYLVRDCELLKDGRPRRLVELGCGLGLAGLSRGDDAGTTKGSAVVLTDGDEAWSSSARAHRRTKRSGPHGARVLRRAPLGRAPRLGRFDVVLAAEVLYDPNVAEESSNALARSCDSLLADGGVVLMAFGAAASTCRSSSTPSPRWLRWRPRRAPTAPTRTFSRSARTSRRCSGIGV